MSIYHITACRRMHDGWRSFEQGADALSGERIAPRMGVTSAAVYISLPEVYAWSGALHPCQRHSLAGLLRWARQEQCC